MRFRSVLLVLTTLTAIGALSSCGDDDGALTGSTTSVGPPATTSAGSSVTTTSAPAAPPSTTTTTAAPADRCDERPGPIANVGVEMPQNTHRECDAEAGWRLFFWIGESGDPIYRVQQLEPAAWVDVDYDVACGLDAALLENLGVPEALATEWGDKYDAQC